MFRNYLKTAWRNLVKYKSFSVINLVGLTFGLASVMTLAFMVYQVLTTNGQFSDSENMYYLRTKVDGGNLYASTTYPFLDEAIRECPQIQAATHVQQWYSPWLKYGTNEFQQNATFVDTGFFKVFSFPLKYGNKKTSLLNKNSIVLSEEVAEKFFGKRDPIGKIIFADDTIALTVTGVMQKISSNTTMRPEILLSTDLLKRNNDFLNTSDWYNDFSQGFLLLRAGADTAQVNKEFAQIVQKFYNKNAKNRNVLLTPFKDYAKNESGKLTNVLLKGQVGMVIFILLILVMNLANLNSATMYNRAKEVAVKKMIGSKSWQIVTQFCIENAVIVFLAMIFSFALFYSVLLPQINLITQSSFGELLPNMKHDYPLIGWFVLGGVIVAIAAAIYPAFYLNSLKPTDVVKGKIGVSNKKNYGRNIFITIQFVLAIICIGVTLVLSKQIQYMKLASLGFDKDNVIVAPLDLSYRNPISAASQFNVLLNKLKDNPYVKDLSTSREIPTAFYNNSDSYVDPITNKGSNVQVISVDAGLIPTYKISMLEGSNFQNLPDSDSRQINKIIINEAAMKYYDWKDAIGKQLRGGNGSGEICTVIGVTRDFHYADLMQNVRPLILYYQGQQSINGNYLSVRVDENHLKEIGNFLQNEFAKIPSRRQFSYDYLNTKIDNQYMLLNGILKVTNFVSVLLIIIASMGLFGLVNLFAKQRIKEIGIRKVFGASNSAIVKMLTQNYFFLICGASIIALPIVYIIMNKWLQDFASRINISWLLLILAALLATFIAMSIVIYQSIKAAKANPVKSLRSE